MTSLVGMPYAGTWPATQRYGSNKAAYARWGMEGHNGCDFGLPVSTMLLACVEGVVTTRQNDPTGYGQYTVLTDGDGGQWLYGHGSLWMVKEGEHVALGAPVGRSGNTGNSTGPHLHFAYRPAGYDRANGYLGYVNPRPFLPLPYRVLLQAGHVGAVPASGAPHEAEWTQRLTDALAVKLQAAGVQTAWCGDFYHHTPPAVIAEDFDLAIFAHYDAAIYAQNTGCIIARGTAETEPWEADRFITEWKRIYPATTGIPLHQERVNPNMTSYYGLAPLTYVTPGIVIEHGVGAPGAGQDAEMLWNHLDLVAAADADAILTYLGRAAPAPVEAEDMGIISELNGQVSALRKEVANLQGLGIERDSQIADLRAEIAGKDSKIGALEHDVVAPLEARVAEMEAQVREAVALAGKATAQRPTRIALEYPTGSLGYVPERT